MVDVLGGDREAGLGAGAAQRLVPEDVGTPPLVALRRAHPARASESVGGSRRLLIAWSLYDLEWLCLQMSGH